MTVPNHEKLLAQADARLYEAKLAGRNLVCGDRPIAKNAGNDRSAHGAP